MLSPRRVVVAAVVLALALLGGVLLLDPPEPSTEPEPAPPLWSSGFEDGDWPEAWHPDDDARHDNGVVVARPDGGHALRVTASGDNDGFTGFGIAMQSPFRALGIEPREEAVLRYSVQLPDSWDPWAGGKLPGLGGVTDGADTVPGGGRYHERGWSGRLMWIPASGPARGEAHVQTYLYVDEAAGREITRNRNRDNDRLYGISVVLREDPDPERPWARDGRPLRLRVPGSNVLEIRYRMNTPGVADGVFQAWLNGELGVDLRDVVYRTEGNGGLKIDRLVFDSFYGGPTANESDETWFFDDVAISERR